jgi:hypothetical protein
MPIMELILTPIAAVWCALVCLYADPATGWARPPAIRRVIAALCIAAPLAAWLILSLNAAAIAAAVIFAAAQAWFISRRARDVGEWESEYARMPRVTFAGSKAHVKHVRNFRYPTVETPIPAYYDATYDIDTLTGVDLVCSYWMGKAIAHVLVSFAFADGRHLAISIETRRRRGQVYSVIAGFFHHYQLMFVIADERDLIGVRTDPRGEEAYIYPLRTTVSERKRLFRGYLAKAEALAEQPEFYDTVFNNCTTASVRLIDAGLPRGQRLGRDWRLLFSGYADEFAYEIGRLKTRLPFAELKKRSLIVRAPGSTIGDDYSTEIRENLPPPDDD